MKTNNKDTKRRGRNSPSAREFTSRYEGSSWLSEDIDPDHSKRPWSDFVRPADLNSDLTGNFAAGDLPLAESQTPRQKSNRPEPRERKPKPAREKIMDYLARRLHSEQELRTKLGRTYTPSEVDDAVRFATENKWMTEPAEISERVAVELNRKKKPHRFINQYLQTKGLPPVAKDQEDEVRKACAILIAKISRHDPPGPDAEYSTRRNWQMKIYRLLAARGFDDQTIRRAMADSQ